MEKHLQWLNRCVQRGLVGAIISRYEAKGLRIAAMKIMNVTEEIARQHYAEHVEKPFFPGLLAYITSGPVVALVIEGKNASGWGAQIERCYQSAGKQPAAPSAATLLRKWAATQCMAPTVWLLQSGKSPFILALMKYWTMTICQQNGCLNKKLRKCLPAAVYKAQSVFTRVTKKNKFPVCFCIGRA